jgi:uncharacterized integral membrane protein
MLLLIGPAVAVIGIVAVVFVMRHKSVEKRSMYSSRRSQIEHKVRAARQRTLTPVKHGEKRAPEVDAPGAAAPALSYEPSPYAAPPVAPPPRQTYSEPAQPGQPAWESEPTAPDPGQPAFAPPPPAIEPPAYEPPAYEPTPNVPSGSEPAWTPTAPSPEPAQAAPASPRAAAETSSAGGGASWSVVGETKAGAEPEPAPKKKGKDDARSGAWQLASGEVAGDEADDAGPKKPSAVLAIAQYAVLVVGLIMVLIGVVVMVANSHGA